MNDPLRLEIVQNRNISLLGVHIGMKRDVAIVILKKFSPSPYNIGISVPNTGYGISYNLDEYGFVSGVHLGICDNGKEEDEVTDFIRYHKKLIQSNFTFNYKKEDVKEGEESISEHYSSSVLRISFYIGKNVRALSGRNSAMIAVYFALGKDALSKPLKDAYLAESMYKLLNYNYYPQKSRRKCKFNIERSTIYVLVICISFIVGMFIYAFSHRYQVVDKGRGIIDKWTGTIEAVKHKK